MSKGSKDYTLDVSRAAIYNLYKLATGEATYELMRVMSDEASYFSFVQAALATGATAHLIDAVTGVETPFTVPAGYNAVIMQTWLSFDQPAEIKVYIDTQLYAHVCPAVPNVWYENDIITFQIGLIDPTYSSAHYIDATLKNLGAESLKGEGMMGVLLQKVGTPPMPETKNVKCKGCGYMVEVDAALTVWKCPECGQVNWYYARKVI